MRTTGIVRRIDDLGRLVIPIEIRRTLNIRANDPFEIYVDSHEKGIYFKLYLPYSEPWRLLEEAAETMRNNEDFQKFVKEVDTLAHKIKNSHTS